MTKQDLRVKFIKENFPHYMKIDALMDFAEIKRIKYALFEAGHYEGTLSQIKENAVSNLIRIAQGKPPFRAAYVVKKQRSSPVAKRRNDLQD